MNHIANIIRALASHGAPADAIASVVEEFLTLERAANPPEPTEAELAIEAIERRRAGDRERQRKSRARQALRAEVERRIKQGEPTNPRALGINPRAIGTNPRARRT